MRSRGERHPRILGRLTLLAGAIGVIAGASYATGLPMFLRMVYPSQGAWLDEHQFFLMESSATVLGLLIGIRAGARLIVERETRRRAVTVAIVFALILFAPLLHFCSAAARYGWSANSGAIQSYLIGRAGYAGGRQLDKLLITGLYFLKTAGLALLAGIAVIAVAAVAVAYTSGEVAEPAENLSGD